MKRCPECRRDYYDETLLYCLDDGSALLDGPASVDEPATAILPQPFENLTDSELPAKENVHTAAVKSVAVSKVLIGVFVGSIVLLGGVAGYRYLRTSDKIESIAVLPFENLSGDPSIEYLSDGIPESLINSLAQLEQLKVVGRGTAFRYKGKDVDAQRVGAELNVQTVLTGRVRQTGDRLDVQVDLVDAATGNQLWGQEYERKSADIVSIKQAIAREITDRMRVKLSGVQQQKLSRREASNGESYQAYLRGRYYWNRRNPESLQKAINEFQRSIDQDPNYALAYVGLADCYSVLEQYAGVSPIETLPKFRAAVERALEIDDSLAEAHTSLASLYQTEWNWVKAEEEFKYAITLDPKYPTAHHWLATTYLLQHRMAESLQEIKIAHELDPLSPIIGAAVATILLLNGETDASEEQCKKVLELDPNFAFGHNRLAWVHVIRRNYKDAVAEFQKASELSQRTPGFLSDLGYGLAVAGRTAEAREIVAELEGMYNVRKASGLQVASVYAGLKDNTSAFAWLEKDLKIGSGRDLPAFIYRNSFDDLRSDPRYAEIVKGVGLIP